ncbi:calcium-binding protein [Thalassospira sp. UBA1131]|uniref:calcium-binding protein n=1 Tax=Thalassospira sp. UBA1131 TaxID=1947672 RepID=UPI0025DFB09C|nr:calcium-binding protein [Thalassospira sp. UBA1131]
MARIIGTPEDDVIRNEWTRDTVYGLEGDDTIYVGSGDTIEGGAGADTFISIHNENYTLSYALSDDPVHIEFYNNFNDDRETRDIELIGRGGDAEGDTLELYNDDRYDQQEFDITGSDNDDHIQGELYSVDGGGGADTIVFDYRDIKPFYSYEPTVTYVRSPEAVIFDQDSMSGTGGDATGDQISILDETTETPDLNIRGSNHDDVLIGGDVRGGILKGAGGDDFLVGGARSNDLWGEWGNDTLLGHGGDDSLNGGSGADFINGGAGQDEVTFIHSNEGVEVELTDGVAIASGGHAEGDVITDVENIFGSRHSDVLIGNSGDNVIDGFYGFDSIYGGDGNDTLSGTYVYGEAGDDILSGQQHGMGGRDTLVGGDGDDTLNGNDGGDQLFGGDGNDTLTVFNVYYDDFFEPDPTYARGGNGDDIIKGHVADDRLYGDAGRDHINGGMGGDHIYGGDGHDVLDGGGGLDNWIEGGDGNDLMRGDTFVYQVFEGGAERDRIVDFNTGADDYSDDYTDHLYFGTTFQEKSGIESFEDFLDHATENETGVYVDFANGRHYEYGVQIDDVTLDELSADNVIFADDEDRLATAEADIL